MYIFTIQSASVSSRYLCSHQEGQFSVCLCGMLVVHPVGHTPDSQGVPEEALWRSHIYMLFEIVLYFRYEVLLDMNLV